MAHARAAAAGAVPYGRYDNALPDAELEPLVRDAAKHETQAGFRWYSRLRMWDFAARRGMEAVEALSDEDFLAGLHEVNRYFTNHEAERRGYALGALRWPAEPGGAPRLRQSLSLIHI